mgnify:CR=1 FL=1
MDVKKAFINSIACFSLIWCSASVAAFEEQGSLNVEPSDSSSTVRMVAGLTKPPFVIETGAAGIQLDMIKAIFATQNMSVEFVHAPFGRNVVTFQRFDIDGLITVPNNYQHPRMLLSEPYIRYQNVAVSLKNNDFNINSVTDLSGKSVIAFQRAQKYLGEAFEKTVRNSINYREMAEQEKQVSSLFLRKAEVIILDENIFRYLVASNDEYSEAFDIHYIFKEIYYSAGFKKEQNQQAFESGLAEIKANGTYQKILDKYLNKPAA